MIAHHRDCDWHVDQYPWECTCGITGPRAAWIKWLGMKVHKGIVRLGPDGKLYIKLPKSLVKEWKLLPGDDVSLEVTRYSLLLTKGK